MSSRTLRPTVSTVRPQNMFVSLIRLSHHYCAVDAAPGPTMPTTAEDFAYPDTDAQYGAVPLPVVKFDGPTALLPRWT